MTTLKKIELESVFLISIVAAASLFFVVQRNSQGLFNVSTISSPLPTSAPEQKVFSQVSPDGSKEVIMEVTQNSDNTSTYDFSTSDSNEENKKPIFTKTLDSLKSMTIPFNTFSSDNKYFFIQENTASGKNIFVFQATGEPFSEGEKYIDVTDLFKKKNTGNNFKEATGWASESLIIINTTGPSYWFEIPIRAIIQLATEF